MTNPVSNPVSIPGGGATQTQQLPTHTYAQAMALRALSPPGGGLRQVLTERGWVRVDVNE